MSTSLGVLLPPIRYRQLLSGLAGPPFSRALELERQYGVRLLGLLPDRLDLHSWTAQGAVCTQGEWTETAVDPAPRLFFNLLSLPPEAAGRVLRDLNGDLRTVIFNEANRWNRGMLYEILTTASAVQSALPVTTAITPDDLTALATRPGLHLLTTDRRPLRDDALLVEYDGARRLTQISLRGRKADPRFLSHWVRSPSNAPRWALQLPGWPVGPDGPVEWRLYLLRAADGTWAVAGEVAKRDALRSASAAERSWQLEPALEATFGHRGPNLAAELRHIALTAAQTLTLFLPGIVHFAADFWLDEAGQPTLVDLSGRYRIDWLRRAGDTNAYKRVADYPVWFANLLARTGVGKLHVDFGRAGGPAGSGSTSATPLLATED